MTVYNRACNWRIYIWQCLGLPFGKTPFVKFYCIYLLIENPSRFLLVVCKRGRDFFILSFSALGTYWLCKVFPKKLSWHLYLSSSVGEFVKEFHGKFALPLARICCIYLLQRENPNRFLLVVCERGRDFSILPFSALGTY